LGIDGIESHARQTSLPSKEPSMTLEKLQLAGSVAALAAGVFVFASPHYAQTMTTSDTDAVVVAAAPATRQAAEDRSIRPFTVHVPEAEFNALPQLITTIDGVDIFTPTGRTKIGVI
jgi:hypothetical protein